MTAPLSEHPIQVVKQLLHPGEVVLWAGCRSGRRLATYLIVGMIPISAALGALYWIDRTAAYPWIGLIALLLAIVVVSRKVNRIYYGLTNERALVVNKFSFAAPRSWSVGLIDPVLRGPRKIAVSWLGVTFKPSSLMQDRGLSFLFIEDGGPVYQMALDAQQKLLDIQTRAEIAR